MERLDPQRNGHHPPAPSRANHRAQTRVDESLAPAWVSPEAWVILRRGRGGGGVGGRLTDREMQVLQGMMSGMGMNTIAARLGIKLGTVKSYRLCLYQKLACDDREPHAIVARAWEIIERARK